MARDFSKNTSNYMSLGLNTVGPLLHGFAHLMFSAQINADSFDVTSFSNPILWIYINGTSEGMIISATSGILQVSARSQAADPLRTRTGTTTLSTGVTYQVGGIIDIGGDTITPYVNGVAEGGGAASFGAATYTQGTPSAGRLDSIGASISGSVPASTARQFDGRISEVGLWASSTAFTAGDMLSLVEHSPELVRPSDLKVYFGLLGDSSPERDYWGGLSGTITGTVAAADHPPIIYPSGILDVIKASGGAVSSSLLLRLQQEGLFVGGCAL